MLPQISKFKGAALDLLFPQRCLGCGEEGFLLCRSCQKSLTRIVPPVCPRCGRPQSSGIICPRCVNWQTALDGIRSPFKFDGLIRQVIHQLKYKNLRSLAAPMAVFLKDYLVLNPLPVQVLIPVPLHRKRLRERGYNQSLLLTRELGKLTGIPVADDCLVRINYLQPQAQTKSADERRANVKAAFNCINTKIQGKQVLLVDDVFTSGATLDASATVLKSAGAISVWGLVLACEI